MNLNLQISHRGSFCSEESFLDGGIGLQSHVPTSPQTREAIAPWTISEPSPEPPSPPPKQRSFGFGSKASPGTLNPARKISSVNLRATRELSIAETVSSTQTERDGRASLNSSNGPPGLLKRLRNKVSKGKLRPDPLDPSEVPPLPVSPTEASFYPKRKRHKPPPVPPKENELADIDLDIGNMDGILAHDTTPPFEPRASSSMNGWDHGTFRSSFESNSYHTLHGVDHHPTPRFRNPWPSATEHGRPRALTNSHVSPKTPLPLPPPAIAAVPSQTPGPVFHHDHNGHDPSWNPPESWEIEPESQQGHDAAGGASSSEESVKAIVKKPNDKRKSRVSRRVSPPYRIRIYLPHRTFRVVNCFLHSTVAEVVSALLKEMETAANADPSTASAKERIRVEQLFRGPHSLYLRERGRERALASHERPAQIVRRRLEQAGYNPADGVERLAEEEIGFLLRFVYRSNSLSHASGGNYEDLSVNNLEHVDLTGRSLQTVPPLLHQFASKIVMLNLSKNPLLEIPLDFIQSCDTLRVLRLSNMAMKKIPKSIQKSQSLRKLDISCNRIADLDEAGLDQIPEFSELKVQNNRLTTLPWYFAHLRRLNYLNISNNKFISVPAIVCEIRSLMDLDLSFNSIAELPEEIGQLKMLDRLVLVGNRITRFPQECAKWIKLRDLDCRRNMFTDLSVVSKLPNLRLLQADHNTLHALDIALGPELRTFDAAHNDITRIKVLDGRATGTRFSLTRLDVSHAKLASLDESALAYMTALKVLLLNNNSFRFIPDTLNLLTELVEFSCADNHLSILPSGIGDLQKLEILDAHNNSLSSIPESLWQCASLVQVNFTSNLLSRWPDPSGSPEPPLASSLQRLYLGENRLTEDVFSSITVLKALQVLNLSFNNVQDLPSLWTTGLERLEELYLSGNQLTSLRGEDLPTLRHLKVLFLNGNRLQTLPAEIGKIQKLIAIDVGSNRLKYNINNWHYDWNWNFNPTLKYLNLSGNERLEIKRDNHFRFSTTGVSQVQRQEAKQLADFAGLKQLRVLGLMDVTALFMPDLPGEHEERRVRSSPPEINGMAYGIADTLGKVDHPSMFDLVIPDFRQKKNECIFGMFGRAQVPPGQTPNNKLSWYLYESFHPTLSRELDRLDANRGETVTDAMRRAFLRLNQTMHDALHVKSSPERKASHASISASSSRELSWLKGGAQGVVLYFVDKKLFVANAGDALAVMSREKRAHLISTKHDPFDRDETSRIRAAEGWVSPKGMVNEEVDVSRSFGFYHLLPVVNSRPDVHQWELSQLDEFVIVANRGLWDYVSYQTAVDIASQERHNPMRAAQKLRDFAISYGADGNTMIMVIEVSDLFHTTPSRARASSAKLLEQSSARGDIHDVNLSRLGREVVAPTGNVAIVFTDIVNSTHLWEVNAGMPTAMRLHNTMFRRLLLLLGGYEVKTEGDAFMVSFRSVVSALRWCLQVQIDLQKEPWPLEILECEDGKGVYDPDGKVIARGLSVRMGIHWGTPACEPDPVTGRMDYFGPMVNRSARINGAADGGQIMCSSDVIREIKARALSDESPSDNVEDELHVVDALRRLEPEIIEIGERKLKGLETPEMLYMVYPRQLLGRQHISHDTAKDDGSGSRVQFSVAQMKQLGILCLRIETLASGRIFRTPPQSRGSVADTRLLPEDLEEPSDRPGSNVLFADPELLLPSIGAQASDAALMTLLDSLSVRIHNAMTTLMVSKQSPRL